MECKDSVSAGHLAHEPVPLTLLLIYFLEVVSIVSRCLLITPNGLAHVVPMDPCLCLGLRMKVDEDQRFAELRVVLLLLIFIINHLVISIVPILSVKVVEFLHAELILISIV